MILRIFCAILGLVVLLNSRAQEIPTVPPTRSVSTVAATVHSPIPPTPAAVSPEKLSDAQEIARALASGKASVIVMLSPPVALARTEFASKASLGVLRVEIKKLQEDVLKTVPANDVKAGHRFENIAGFSAEVSASGLKALQAHPQVMLIEPVVILKAHLAQGIALMHGMTYRSIYNGAGMAIAICDAGVDYNHPRLGGGGFPNSKVIGGFNFGDNSPDPAPQGEAHGTACAGIAAGNLGTVGDYIGGVAYNAKIYALKITTGSGGTATTADMVAAWDWCVTHKDDDPNNPIMVISTSFGGGQYFAACDTASTAMTAAANNAVAAGITVLASSGNEGYCNALAWPSCITSVISVGAVYDASFGHFLPCIDGDSCAPKTSTMGCATGWYADDTSAADKVTSYANVASFLTLLAPGNQCYTLDIAGSGGYSSGDYFSEFGGTSASCPYAAGAVACLQSAAKALTGNYLTPQEIRDRLTATGDNITDTKVAITKPRVNLERAFSPGVTVVSAILIGGNGNQSVDPNECSELRVVVRNDGFFPATNIFATLNAAIPGVSLVQQSSGYPNLAPGAMGTNITLFRFSTAPSFVCGAPVNFALSVTSSTSTNVAPFGLISGSTNYVVTQSSGASITPGTSDIGNHGDDVTTSVALPFPFTFYGQVFSNATVSANGNLQFTSASSSAVNSCLPVAGFGNAIFAFWDDLRTDGTVGAAQGIFTSMSGVAPNRIFNIEWRASYFHPGRKGNPVNFEVRLYENRSRFDIVYGTLNGNGLSATVGSQKESNGASTQFECNSGGLSTGLQLAFQTVCTDGGGACVVAPTVNFTGTPTSGILPMTVSFTNFTTGATNYSWNFGDGNTSTATNPGNIYSNAGNYSVSLSAIGPGGTNALTRTNYITVYTTNALPGVTNQPQSLTVNQGQNATFNVGASGLTPLSYQWRFSGTNIAGATASSYTRTSAQCAYAGAYQVVITNSLGATTSSVAALTVIAPPSISAQPQNLTVVEGQSATFNVTATAACGGGLTYQWRLNTTNISDATASSLALTNAHSADAGSYSVVVTNFAGSVTSTVATLTVNVPPSITEQPQSQTVDQGSNATFTVTATGTAPFAYRWRFNSTNIAGATASSYTRTNAQPPDAGSYTVVVTNVAGAVTSLVATLEVTIPPPTADFVGAPTSGVAPLTVNFTNLTTVATNYSWTFGDGNTSTATNASNVYSNAGNYSVTLIAVGPGGTNTLTQTNYIVVTNHPPPIADFRAEPTNGVAPLIVAFTNLSAEATGFAWDFGDGNSSTNISPLHIYTNAGNFTVTLTASGPGGISTLTQTNYIVVTNHPPPIADFRAEPTNGVAPLVVAFTNLSAEATGFAWDFGDGNSSTNLSPLHVYTNAGNFTVTLTASGPGGTSTLTQTNYIVVTNHPPTIANFTAEPTNGVAPLVVVFTNLSPNATDFTWDFGDGNSSTNASPTNVYTSQGSYTVTLTATGLGGTNTLVQINYIVLSNSPPTLAPISNQMVIEETPLTLIAVATDADANQHLVFSLDTNAPAGAQINSTNGVFTWTPTQTQAGSTNEITVIATDDGTPPLAATQTFTIIVLKTNHPPVLAPIADRTVHAGTTVVITNSATDSDIPADTLTFSLDPGAPPGSFIDPVAGILTWTPDNSFALTTNAITARVSDDGAPPMSDAKTFTITVISQPKILSITLSNDVSTITWSAITGQSYRLQFKGDLNETNWSDAFPDVIATEPAASKNDSLEGVRQRYYRILVR